MFAGNDTAIASRMTNADDTGVANTDNTAPYLISDVGLDEFQSYSVGHVTGELQVGSRNGRTPSGPTGFSETGNENGRVILYGPNSGLYFHKDASTWSLHSDADLVNPKKSNIFNHITYSHMYLW